MHPAHKLLRKELKKHAGRGNSHSNSDSYISSGHLYYDISNPVRRHIAKNWLKNNKEISTTDFLKLIDSLYQGKSHEEKSLASILLGYQAPLRKDLKPARLDRWLDHLVGWAEVDSLCQNVFTANELLGHWRQWEALIRKLSQSRNINKRRASLVLLTGPTYRSDDARLANLAFKTIETLKHEDQILITKAISWLLRDMSRQHKKEVEKYLKTNEEALPRVALRETWRKIKTGRK